MFFLPHFHPSFLLFFLPFLFFSFLFNSKRLEEIHITKEYKSVTKTWKRCVRKLCPQNEMWLVSLWNVRKVGLLGMFAEEGKREREVNLLEAGAIILIEVIKRSRPYSNLSSISIIE